MKTCFRHFTAIALGASLVGLVPAGARAASGPPAPTTPFYMNYDITLGAYPVSSIVMFEQGAPNPDPNGYGITASFETDANTTTTLTDPFLKTNPIIANFLMGVTTGLPGDADGQQHLVLFTNNAFAAAVQGIAFGTLFPNTNEATLITDLTNLDYNSTDDDLVNQAFDDLSAFASGDALTSTDGGIAFGSTDNFTAIAFSGGQTIGTGRAYETTPVPEPADWSLLLLGCGALGWLRCSPRRRRAGV